MGLHTSSDIVSNVAYIGKFQPMIDLLNEYADSGDEANFIGKDYPIGNGWTIIQFQQNRKKMGKKGRLIGEVITKDDMEVCVVNTSPYESVGEFDYAVFSDDRAAVEMFLMDFGLKEKIEDMDSVNQTL